MQPLDPGFVRIFNPETEGTAVVPKTSLAQHYRAGWVPLDESPEPKPEPEPPAAARAKAKPKAADDKTDQSGAAGDAGSEG